MVVTETTCKYTKLQKKKKKKIQNRRKERRTISFVRMQHIALTKLWLIAYNYRAYFNELVTVCVANFVNYASIKLTLPGTSRRNYI